MRKSHMKKDFGQTPTVSKPRSTFNHNHSVSTTIDGGIMYPIQCKEVLPGDTWNQQTHVSGRFATPIFPIMDNIKVTFMTFFVPNRLVWENWERFMGQQDDPSDSTDFTIPQIYAPTLGTATLSLADYMGIPLQMRGDLAAEEGGYSALPFRAHHLIYNTWIRDQNLIDSLTVELGDGPDLESDYDLFRRAKRPDYFTTCLPFLQKGDPIELSFGGVVDVDVKGAGAVSFTVDGNSTTLQGGTSGNLTSWVPTPSGGNHIATWDDPALEVDLSAATANTVNQIRLAFQTQELLEQDARNGTRYIEKIFGEFGIRSPDARHQRPELLSIHTKDLNITPVPQTTSTDATTPQGNLAAYGTVTGPAGSYVKSFTEHGTIITYAQVHVDLTYQQGLDRSWCRKYRYDFYTPLLANLGEQAVLNKEIMAIGNLGPGQDAAVFGYQERWSEYRSSNSRLTGQMRSTAALTLDPWHCAQEFSVLPVLGQDFIEDNPPFDRNIEVTNEPHLLLNAYFTTSISRVMGTYSIPQLTSMKL